MPPNGPVVQGRAAMQKFFAGFPKITAFKENVVEIAGYGDLVHPRGTYEMTMMPPGAKTPLTDIGKVLAVWRKQPDGSDRKSTRLNSSHRTISYAVFCLQKKKTHNDPVLAKCAAQHPRRRARTGGVIHDRARRRRIRPTTSQDKPAHRNLRSGPVRYQSL